MYDQFKVHCDEPSPGRVSNKELVQEEFTFHTRKSARLFIKRIYVEGDKWVVTHPNGIEEAFVFNYVGGEDNDERSIQTRQNRSESWTPKELESVQRSGRGPAGKRPCSGLVRGLRKSR